MVKGYFVLKNKLGQAARTFHWDLPQMTVVFRHDNGRLETIESTQDLDDQGVSYYDYGTYNVEKIVKNPIELGDLGRIEFTLNIESLAPTPKASEEQKDTLKPILRWTAVGHLVAVALVVVVHLFIKEDPLPEPQIVQVFEQKPEEKKPEKKITVSVSEKKIIPHNKKMIVKPTPTKKVVVAKAKPTPQPKTKTAARHIERIQKQVNLNNLGALGVLGAPNPKSQKAGGFDISKISNRRAGGAGGSVPTNGSSKTFLGQGLVGASPGSGDKAQLVGGYGTRGKAGGQSGYGQISMVGAGAAFSSPVDSEATVEGGLDRDQIAAVIRRNIGQVRFCYEKGLQVESDLSGRVSIRFVINGSGGVNVASVANSSLNDSKVENCVVSRLKTWRFPKPVGGVNVRVTYPFVLKRVSQG